MRNKDVLEKVKDLDTQTLHSREQSLRVMVQIAIIRRAFGVKNDETEMPIKDYERNVVLSDDEIRNEFKRYSELLQWAISTNDVDKQTEFRNQIVYFIDGVSFFNATLANEFNLAVEHQ